MSFFRRHWYEVGLVVAVGAVVGLFGWQHTSVVQKLLLLNFVAPLIHQYEEYGCPGGGPGIVNIVMRPNSSAGPVSAEPE